MLAAADVVAVAVTPVLPLANSETRTVQAVYGFAFGISRAASFKAFNLSTLFVFSILSFDPSDKTFLGFLTGFFATAFFFTGFLTAFLTGFLATFFVFGFVAVVLVAWGFVATLVAVAYVR